MMYTIKDVFKLYWANIKSYWADSFIDRTEAYHTSYFRMRHSGFDRRFHELDAKSDRTPEEQKWYQLLLENKGRFRGYPDSYLLLVWNFELIVLLPGIIIVSFIRTIFDMYTRTPQTQPVITQLVNTIDDLLQNHPENFDVFIGGIQSQPDVYRSYNSNTLITDLYLITIAQNFLSEDKKTARERQAIALKDYLNNPENNGCTLMSYIQTNVSEKMLDKTTREAVLKERALNEANRIELEQNDMNGKPKRIREAVADEPFNEKMVQDSLGFFRDNAFFLNMPKSYKNVFCTDEPGLETNRNMASPSSL